MKIIKPQDFLLTLKDKHLLLDTNVFIDAFLHPDEFSKLFSELKDNNTTLVSIDLVLIEFAKGSSEAKKFTEKKLFIEEVIDLYLPVTKDTFDKTYDLIKIYKEDGKGASITDLTLGATLVQYPNNLFLLTKNTNDFPTNIFTLTTCINLFHRKAIQNYGVYTYTK